MGIVLVAFAIGSLTVPFVNPQIRPGEVFNTHQIAKGFTAP